MKKLLLPLLAICFLCGATEMASADTIHPSTTWFQGYLTYDPGTGASAIPMSGTIDWAHMDAYEDDVGHYYPGMGTPETPGYSVSNPWKTLESGDWYMNWSQGSEGIPDSPIRTANLTPTSTPEPVGMIAAIPEPATMLLLGSGLIGLAATGRKKFFNKKNPS